MLANYYCSAEDVRKVIGLREDDVPDEDLNYYIGNAQKYVLDRIGVYVFDDFLVGAIDGSNTTFDLHKYPVADSNFDGTVTVADCTVSAWGNTDDISTKSSVSISTMYAQYGQVILDSAPANTIDAIVAEYYYYPRQIKLDRLHRPTAIRAAYNYVSSEMLLHPKQWMHGAYRFIRGEPTVELRQLFEDEMLQVVGRLHKKGKHDSLKFLRDE